MTIVLMTPPDVSQADLLFDETETRSILGFYWPQYAGKLGELEINDAVRLFAQQLLIVGVDSSYALGFMEQLMKMYLQPRSGFTGLKSMGMKLARRYLQHWWRHATQKDLENPRVAEAVRSTVARNFGTDIGLLVNNAAYVPRMAPFTVAAGGLNDVWGAI
ncbi:hypothetical protein M8A51_08505 [Schlegelella sp. S2-27]|uniref:Uncharacterized protein n=1 Tax=Caldimonas mangrovi TaxID=2944811 RepID=A0ABT0YLG0_9BURK|nr:hypothetical protein [Caldimonas mangrovi]MCM5679572.1 hypothetical protein [Caldimonas mangrovi]